MAAGVAAVAVLALQQRADAPALRAASPVTAQNRAAVPKEAISYTVPAALPEAPAVLPAARLTNYVFAHSQYSSVLGQRNVLSGLLADADEQQAAGDGRAMNVPAANAHAPAGAAGGSARRSMSKPVRRGPQWLIPCAVAGALAFALTQRSRARRRCARLAGEDEPGAGHAQL